MNVFSRSWRLFKSTLAVLRSEPSLLWFPVLAAITVLIVSALFVGALGAVLVANPSLQASVAAATEAADQGQNTPPWMMVTGFVLLFLYYLVTYSFANYFMTGMTAAALRRLDGHDTSFSEGIQIANSRLGVIIGFSAIAATVGVILSALRNNRNGGNVTGAILSAIGGMAWTIATFLVIPVIAAKPIGAIDAIKESASLLRKTWGEQIVGAGGLGALFGLLTLLIIVVFGGLAFLTTSVMPVMISLIVVGVIFIVLMSVLSSTLGGIYKAAVYRYAAAGETSPGFDPQLVQGAFRLKRGLAAT